MANILSNTDDVLTAAGGDEAYARYDLLGFVFRFEHAGHGRYRIM